MTFKLVSLLMALLIFSMPCVILAQQTSDAAQAMIDAKNDIKEPFGWFAGSFLTSVGLGCLGGSIIVATSQVISVSPPVDRFVGKSPDYVSSYTSTYERETKHKRLIHTSAGCVSGSAIAGLITAYLFLYTY